jgi:hypothetical protein
MIAPKRFSDGPQSERVGALLRSMRADAPRPQSKARMLSAMGLGAGLVGTAAEAGAVIKAAAAAKSAGVLVPVASLVKWVGLGVLLGGVSLAGLSRLGQLTPAASPSVSASAQPSLAASAQAPIVQAPAAAPSAPMVSAAGDPSVEPMAAKPLSASKAPAVSAFAVASVEPAAPIDLSRTTSSATALGSPSEDAAPDLVQEVRALDRARAAIAAGNGAVALRTLDEYRATFRRRQLDSEALMLQIQAMVMTGDRAGAQALARSFVAQNPRSPLVDRVRSLTGLDREGKDAPR